MDAEVDEDNTRPGAARRDSSSRGRDGSGGGWKSDRRQQHVSGQDTVSSSALFNTAAATAATGASTSSAFHMGIDVPIHSVSTPSFLPAGSVGHGDGDGDGNAPRSDSRGTQPASTSSTSSSSSSAVPAPTIRKSKLTALLAASQHHPPPTSIQSDTLLASASSSQGIQAALRTPSATTSATPSTPDAAPPSALGSLSSMSGAAGVGSSVRMPQPPQAGAHAYRRRNPLVSLDDIKLLIKYFTDNEPFHDRNDATLRAIQAKCQQLFELDYQVGVINNVAGQLCSSYPLEILVLESHKSVQDLPSSAKPAPSESDAPGAAPPLLSPSSSSSSSAFGESAFLGKVNDAQVLHGLFKQSKFARVRCRFAVPVILCEGKNVCRSGTISREAEVKLNMAREKIGSLLYDKFFGSSSSTTTTTTSSSTAAALLPEESTNTGSKPFFVSSSLNDLPSAAKTGGELSADLADSEIASQDAVTEVIAADVSLYDTAGRVGSFSDLRASQSTGSSNSGGSGSGNGNAADFSIARQRANDIQLLKQMAVKHICDLMVENKKIKYGMSVCSSEKVDSHGRYSGADISIVTVPYPGVEFFRDYKANRSSLHHMRFDWTQSFVNAALNVPPSLSASTLAVSWSEYKSWDVIALTRNYLQLFLRYLASPSSSGALPEDSLLIHCISGWDRTPLFISLLRMSLWADGKSNESLFVEEMLYLTIAYDWLLFGHMLKDRVSREEDIFLFCFDFLSFITGSEYSFDAHKETLSSTAAKAAHDTHPAPIPEEASADADELFTATRIGDALTKRDDSEPLTASARALPVVAVSSSRPVPQHPAHRPFAQNNAADFSASSSTPSSQASSVMSNSPENEGDRSSQSLSPTKSDSAGQSADDALNQRDLSHSQSPGSWSMIGSMIATSFYRGVELASKYRDRTKSKVDAPKRRRSSAMKGFGAQDAHGIQELDDNGDVLSEAEMVAKSMDAKKQEQAKFTLSLRSQRLLAVKDVFFELISESRLDRTQMHPSASSPSLLSGAGSQLWNWVVPKLVLPVFGSPATATATATATASSSAAAAAATTLAAPAAVPASVAATGFAASTLPAVPTAE